MYRTLTKTNTMVLMWLGVVLLLFASFSEGRAQPPAPRDDGQILILIGPQYGLPMVDAITPAIVNTLQAGGVSLDDIYVEFLDLHRNPGVQHRSHVLALLEHRVENTNIRVIITVNQGATFFFTLGER